MEFWLWWIILSDFTGFCNKQRRTWVTPNYCIFNQLLCFEIQLSYYVSILILKWTKNKVINESTYKNKWLTSVKIVFLQFYLCFNSFDKKTINNCKYFWLLTVIILLTKPIQNSKQLCEKNKWIRNPIPNTTKKFPKEYQTFVFNGNKLDKRNRKKR